MTRALRVRRVMAALSVAAAAVAGPVSPGWSQGAGAPKDGVEVGQTVICDTQAQMERFVVLFEGDYSSAMDRVNTEERNPTACIGATMAYMRGGKLSKAKGASGTFTIIKVLVVGIDTPRGFQAIQPAAFFSIEKIEEVDI